ncbi:MAG: HAMP domain-containing sensor histidine kinase [bacterium]
MNGSRSIRARLILALVGVSVFTLVVVGVVFYVFLGGYVLDRQKERLLDQAVQVAEQVEELSSSLPSALTGNKALSVLLKADLKVLPAGAGILVFRGSEVLAKVGTVPVKEQSLAGMRIEGQRLTRGQPSAGVVKSVVDAAGRRVNVLVAAAPVQFVNGPRGLAVVTLSTADAYAARSGLVRMLLISGAIAIALAVIVGLGLGSWMTRPLRRLSVAARGMAGGSYDQPVTGTYPGEVQELATSLETMRIEVRRSEESLRGFVASAAHELRTPLTSIQGFSQALLDGTADTSDQRQRSAAAIYRESARLQRLVDALLTLSRFDSGEFHPTLTPVAVGALIREEVERLVQAGLAETGRIAVQADQQARAVADADMLRQVVANLLRNAVQYGGVYPVTVTAWTEGGELLIQVANGGEPLDPEERARIFERFYRGRGGRRGEGFGLGLALVREICGLLGGRVELVGDGPSTVFRVAVPTDPGGNR